MPSPIDFEWSGFEWQRRPATESGDPTYNGLWDPENVVLNGDGSITLKITNPTGTSPSAAEFYSKRRGWGYGTYTSVVDTRLDTLDKSVVFGGLFTYDPDTPVHRNEIDVHETSAWGGGAVQDWPVRVEHVHFIDNAGVRQAVLDGSAIIPATAVQTHVMRWEPDRITWESYEGEGTGGLLINRSVATEGIPKPGAERLHYNLWVFGGNQGDPDATPLTEVTIRRVQFRPLEATRSPDLSMVRLEVEVEPEGLPNLVPNTSGDLGAWGWRSPVGNTAVVATTGDDNGPALEFVTYSAQPAHFTTEAMPLAAGRYAAARLQTAYSSNGSTMNLKARFEFLDASKSLISSGVQSANMSGYAVTHYLGATQAPAGTVFVRLRLDLYKGSGNPAAGEFAAVRDVMVTHAATSGEIAAVRTNLIPNPSFENDLDGWVQSGSVTRTAAAASVGGYGVSLGSSASIRRHPRIPVTGGKTYTLSFDARHPSISGNPGFNAQIVWYRADGKPTSAYASKDFYDTVTTFERRSLTATAPSKAVTAAVVVSAFGPGTGHVDALLLEAHPRRRAYFDGSSADTADVTHDWVGAAHGSASTQTLTSAAFPFVEPITWADVLGPTHTIKVSREGLSAGTLTATILDADLDPVVADVIRPGRAVRLMVLTETDWEAVFTGTTDKATVTYDLSKGTEDSRHARVELTAFDATATLSGTKRRNGVAEIADLPYLLEGAGVPWDVNGSGNQIVSATVVAENDNASLLDQIAITRDSNLALAWVSRNGVLRAYDRTTLEGNPVNNGHFQSDTGYWFANHSTFTHDTTYSHQGRGSGRFESLATGRAAVSESLTIAPGSTRTLTAYLRVEDALSQPYGMAVEFVENLTTYAWRGGVYGTDGDVAVVDGPTDGWVKRSLTFTVPNDATGILIYPVLADAAGAAGDVIWVDSVTLLNQTPVLVDEGTYSDLDVSFSTEDCINEVSVKWLRKRAKKGDTKEIVYGPYRDENSISEWGVHPAEFTLQGAVEGSVAIAAHADAILDANAIPRVQVNSVTFPVLQEEGLVGNRALTDLYDLVNVANAMKGVDEYLRVTSITHDIAPGRWVTTLGFAAEGTVATPQSTPSPDNSNKAVSNDPQTGTGTVTLAFDGVWASLWVSFETPFSTTPTVVACWDPTAPADPVFVAAGQVDTTGFNLWARRNGGTASVKCSWIAVV